MAQYTTIVHEAYLDLSDGIDSFRYINLSGILYLRQAITPTGFSGAEGVDWDDIEDYPSSGGGIWRIGVRSLFWVMDCTITIGAGFAGTENIDWENYEQHQLP